MFRFRSARSGEGGMVILVICAIRKKTSVQYEVSIGQFHSTWRSDPVSPHFHQHAGDALWSYVVILRGVIYLRCVML